MPNVPGITPAINIPVHVGHPVNNPVMADMLKNHFVLFFGLLLIANEMNITLIPTKIDCLNTIADTHLTSEHVYTPSSRHLQIRFDTNLKRRLKFRSAIAALIRRKGLPGFNRYGSIRTGY